MRGIRVTALATRLVKVDGANLPMLTRIDYMHLAAMAIFLGGLEYALEEELRHDWFGDLTIATAAWLFFVGFALFFERSFRSAMPQGEIERVVQRKALTLPFNGVFPLMARLFRAALSWCRCASRSPLA